MKAVLKAIKKAIPCSFGASLGIIIGQTIHYPGFRGPAERISDFLVTFAVMVILIPVFSWIWDLIRGNKSQKPQ